MEDPRGFLYQYKDGATFDEVQRAPDLFSYLQGFIYKSKESGRYILTGSQQFGLMSGITQSLAGRLIEGVTAEHLLADKAYDSDAIIEQAQDQGMSLFIPPCRNRKEQREYDEELYKLRHLVENAFLHLKTLARHRDPLRQKHRILPRCRPYKMHCHRCKHLVTTLSKQSTKGKAE